MSDELDAAPARRPRAGEGGISLRKRVYLLMAVGSFFPMLVMGAAGLHWLHSMDERVLAGRLAAAAAIAAHFDAQLTDDLELLQRLAAGVAGGLEDADLVPERRALREAHERFRHREALFLLGRNAEVIAEEPQAPYSGVPRAALPLVREVLANGRPRLSGLVLDERGAVIHELVPIRNWRGEVIGVAGGTFRPERRDFARMLRHLRRGQTGMAEILDDTGRIIASTERGRAGGMSECSVALGGLVGEKRAVTTRCTDCHVERGIDLRPTEHLTFTALGGAPWGIVMRQATSETLPSEGALPWYAVAALLGIQLGVVSAFAWGAARSVTHPVGVLTEHAERIAGGELASPIPDLGGDEVGRLGTSLEKMRQNLSALIADVEQVNARLEARVAVRTRELNAANAQLKEREEARGQLLRKVITAQEDERKRIARELHDETSQGLAVLAMGLEAAQDAIRGGKSARLDEVKALAVRTLEDVHRIILDLRPSVLDDLGLLSAIRWYADRQLASRGISVRCEFGEMPRLPPEMETALFRLCQETMSNVARHAQASAVLVQVGVEGEELRIEIEDDGTGFEPEAVARREGRRSWGLLGIRERAEILGGVAVVESAPGQGTRVAVRIPLPADAVAADADPAAGAPPQADPGAGELPTPHPRPEREREPA
jgi:signal transduction histidine kinase